MSRVQAVSKAILRQLSADFRDRGLGSDVLHNGYVGVSLIHLKQTCVGSNTSHAVDFDLALDELERDELVETGPMVAIENPPDSMLVFIGLESKREYVCLTEKGYKMIDDDFAFPDHVDVKTASDGEWHSNIRAQVNRNEIVLLSGTLPVSEGDEMRRVLPNGITEEYSIVHVEFQAAEMDFPAMITAHVRKRGSGLHEHGRANVQHIYNVSGPNSRVNVNSVDESVNVQTVNEATLFSDLAKAISGNVADASVRDQLTALVKQMEATRGTPGFTAHFQSFMALAANCMTIVMPFIPALTQMLNS